MPFVDAQLRYLFGMHIRSEHFKETIALLDWIYQEHYRVMCHECDEELKGWDSMRMHMREKHGLKPLDMAARTEVRTWALRRATRNCLGIRPLPRGLFINRLPTDRQGPCDGSGWDWKEDGEWNLPKKI